MCDENEESKTTWYVWMQNRLNVKMMKKSRGRIEIQPRCKIQYPMKNHYKDGLYKQKDAHKREFAVKKRSST